MFGKWLWLIGDVTRYLLQWVTWTKWEMNGYKSIFYNSLEEIDVNNIWAFPAKGLDQYSVVQSWKVYMIHKIKAFTKYIYQTFLTAGHTARNLHGRNLVIWSYILVKILRIRSPASPLSIWEISLNSLKSYQSQSVKSNQSNSLKLVQLSLNK